MDSADSIIISDMTQCRPREALSRDFELGKWQAVDYETGEGVKGVMVSALPEAKCRTLTLPLNLTGPHRVFLGINYTKTHHPRWSSYGILEVKLSKDLGFHRVGAEPLEDKNGSKMGIKNQGYKSIQEAYWKTADLTGQSLVIRPSTPPFDHPQYAAVANVSYVRLEPLDHEGLIRWEQGKPRDETRNLGLIYCTGILSGSTDGIVRYHPEDEQWCANELTPHVNTDVGLFIYEALRGNYACYRSEIGHYGTEDNVWQDHWIDPLTTFTRLAHENNMKIFAAMRMIGVQYPMNKLPIGWATYYWQHPEWAKRSREGLPLTGLSLAFPEVRRYWISLLRETLQYGIDGIQLHLNRSTPFVYYEEPVVETFKEKHGEDPRALPEDDPRWLAHRTEYVTQFLREVRELLDEKAGRELGVTIYGTAHKYDPHPEGYHPRRYLCDVEGWIDEGLIQYLLPASTIDTDLIRKWRKIAGDTVHLWPGLMPRTQPPQAYAALAEKYYEAGADGFCIWDGERRPPRISEWAGVRLLGHRDLLDYLKREGPYFYRRIPLKTLAGFDAQESFHDG